LNVSYILKKDSAVRS